MKNLFQVYLGVIRKNEQYEEDMIDILEYLHPYVPFHDPESNSKPVKVLSGGDYLTFERHKEAQSVMQDARTPSSRMEGLIPKIEDFHNQAEWLKVIRIIVPMWLPLWLFICTETWPNILYMPVFFCYIFIITYHEQKRLF